MKSSAVTQINEWTLEMTGDALEKTNFASTYDREFQPGLRSWTVSMSGFSEDADNVQDYLLDNFTATGGPKATTSVYAVLLTNNNTGSKAGFQGQGVITGLTRGATPDGYQTFSANLQGSGLLATYSTA
jgi:hypothetical protein